MRNISFSATTEQVRNRQKHVTRRLIHPGKRSIWQNLKPDEHLMGIEKGQGLKKGEKVKRITEIVVLDATPEPLDEIIRRPMRKAPQEIFLNARQCCPFLHQNVAEYRCGSGANLGFCCGINECPGIPETTLEGFPDLSPVEFVEMFMELNKCKEDAPVVRILFDYKN